MGRTRTGGSIEVGHRRGCASETGKRCRCQPAYRAVIRLDGRKMAQTFPTEAAARLWLTDAVRAKSLGTLSSPAVQTLSEATAETFDLMRRGLVLNRNRQRYRLNVIQNYQAAYANHVAAHVGSLPLGGIRTRHLQTLADGLRAGGLAPSTVRNALKPVQVVFRRALRDELIASNPCALLDLERGGRLRERIATPAEAELLLAALRPDDRALWACALYAGLRQGELMALDWNDIDFKARLDPRPPQLRPMKPHLP